jgi:hypothetical protein
MTIQDFFSRLLTDALNREATDAEHLCDETHGRCARCGADLRCPQVNVVAMLRLGARKENVARLCDACHEVVEQAVLNAVHGPRHETATP